MMQAALEPFGAVRPIGSEIKAVAHAQFHAEGLQPEVYYEEHRAARLEMLPGLTLTPTQLWCKVAELARAIEPQYWIRLVYNRALAERLPYVIIPDVRTLTEFLFIRDYAGLLIRMDRPQAAPVPGAQFDDELGAVAALDWDCLVLNSFDDLEQLEHVALDICLDVALGRRRAARANEIARRSATPEE